MSAEQAADLALVLVGAAAGAISLAALGVLIAFVFTRGEPAHLRRETMTDANAPAPAAAPPPPKPIEVKASAAPIVTAEVFKPVFVAGCAFACDKLLHSDVAIAAALPAIAGLATFAWSGWQRVSTWRAFRHVANRAPDEVAVVTPTPWWRFWR